MRQVKYAEELFSALMTSRVSPPQGPLKAEEGLPHGYVWSFRVHSFLTVLIIVPCSVRYTQGEVKATAADGLPPCIGPPDGRFTEPLSVETTWISLEE